MSGRAGKASAVKNVLSDFFGGLVRLGPQPAARWRVGLRSAAAVTVPLVVFALCGYPELGLQAASGAFVSFFVSSLPVRERAKALLAVGALLLVAAALGVLTAMVPWVAVLALVVVAITGCWVMLAFQVGPPGPVFVVLVFGLAGLITGPDPLAGDAVRKVDPLLYLAVFTSGLVLAYVVSVIPLTAPGQLRVKARPFRELLPGPHLGASGRTQLWRMSLGAVVAALVSVVWLDETRAYWTVATAVAVIGLNPQRRVVASRSVHRTVGTLLGLVVYVALAQWVTEFWVLVAVLAVLQFLIEWVVVRNYALALVCITPLVLLLNGAVGSGDIGSISEARVVDTLVGSAVGLGVVLVRWRPRQKSLPGV